MNRLDQLAKTLTDDDTENGKQQFEYLRDLVADADGVLQKLKYFRQKTKNKTVKLLEEADRLMTAAAAARSAR